MTTLQMAVAAILVSAAPAAPQTITAPRPAGTPVLLYQDLDERARERAEDAREREEEAREQAREREEQAREREEQARERAEQARERIEQIDERYEQGREQIEDGRYDRALNAFDTVISANGRRADAAMYWKAYSLAKLARGAEALATLAQMEKAHPDSRWLRDARALAVEVKQAAGQPVGGDSADEEIQLLAMRGLMQSDPETALPIVEKLLAGSSSVRVKDRALFVVSQSRSPRAREVLLSAARGTNANPDLQLRAVRYLGMMRGAENLQALEQIYRGTNDIDIKRSVLSAYQMAGANARDRLLALAKSEQNADLRASAVRYLAMAGGGAELEELYRSEKDIEVRRRILQSFSMAGQSSDRVINIVKMEQNPELRRLAVRSLGMMGGRPGVGDALVAIYNSDQTLEVKKAAIDALRNSNQARALVTLARTEKNIELRKEIVSRLSTMRSQEARDYMLELLK